MADALVINERLVIDGRALSWSAARTSGPGGQNVNKVASKVDLRFDPRLTGALTVSVRARLYALAKGRLDSEGRIVITCQTSRDQSRNLAEARDKLRELIVRALVPPKVRRPTAPTRGSERRRLASKQLHGDKKRQRTRGYDD